MVRVFFTFKFSFCNKRGDSCFKTITLTTFGASQFEVAVKAYLDLERKHFDDQQINAVLVNTGDIKKLEESYPNYFMDTKTLVTDLSLIMLGKFI